MSDRFDLKVNKSHKLWKESAYTDDGMTLHSPTYSLKSHSDHRY